MQNGGLRIKGVTKISQLEKPLITVVTVVYNGVETLEQTVKSVLNQIYDNLEYIIIDGGSTDGTLDIIKKYEDKIDYWQSAHDKGIYDAMNKALSLATGDFLIFMGADDLFFTPYAINKAVKLMTQKSCIYYGNSYFATCHKVYDGSFCAIKLAIKNICHQSMFYPKSVYSNELYNLKYKVLADYEYNIRMWKKNKFVYIPVEISNYYNKGISSYTSDDDFFKDKPCLVFKNLGFISFLSCLFFHFMILFYKLGRTILKRKSLR